VEEERSGKESRKARLVSGPKELIDILKHPPHSEDKDFMMVVDSSELSSEGSYCRELIELLQSTGSKLQALWLGPVETNKLWWDDNSARESFLLRAKRLLKLSSAYGAEWIRLPSPSGPYEETYEQTLEALMLLEPFASGNGVRVGVAMPGCFSLLSPLEAQRLIDEVNSWWVGACLNTLTPGLKTGKEALSRRVEWLEEWSKIIGRRLLHVEIPLKEKESASDLIEASASSLAFPVAWLALV
jgi:hypothetical protein